MIIALDHGIFVVKFLIATLVPDQPKWVRLALAKQKYSFSWPVLPNNMRLTIHCREGILTM